MGAPSSKTKEAAARAEFDKLAKVCFARPKSAWQNIEMYIPKDKQIWESFYGDGTSAENLKELGFDVVSEPIDFYKEDRGDIIVTNPPFSRL